MCWFKRKECNHKYPAFVNEDGFQYCIFCGKAEQITIECKHEWVFEREVTVFEQGKFKEKGDYPVYINKYYECHICKDIKSTRLK